MVSFEPAGAPAAPRVLVVDDEPEIAALIVDLLGAAGYAATSALSGAAALQHLRDDAWDAIVCDLRMPGLDGPGLWREVRSVSPDLARRMLFVTGDTLSRGAQDFLDSSGCPRLDKPFRRQDLLQQLRDLLS